MSLIKQKLLQPKFDLNSVNQVEFFPYGLIFKNKQYCLYFEVQSRHFCIIQSKDWMGSQKRFPASVKHPLLLLDVRQVSEELLPADPLSLMVWPHPSLQYLITITHWSSLTVSHLFVGIS